MNNNKFNGFASEEQYLAVKQAVNDAVVNSSDLDEEIDVKCNIFDEIGFSIDVHFCDGFNLTICDDGSIEDIECDFTFHMFEVEMIQDIYESAEDILEVYEQYQPKEQSV